jgi:hypothetical protein
MPRHVLLLLLLFPLLAVARSGSDHAPLRFDPAGFDAQRERLQQAIASETRYSEISAVERREVSAALDTIGTLFERGDSLDALSAEDRAALRAAEQRLNAALSDAAESSRQVCRRETRLGSNMPVRVCKSVARLRQESEAASHTARDLERLESLRGG